MKTKKIEQKNSKKIRKGDKVVAIAGNYRGMAGTVLSCENDRAVVRGLNVRTRHIPKQGKQPGRKVELEKPLHISNLRLCSEDESPLKVKMRKNKEGERHLYYQDANGEEVLYRPIKKAHK